jgi:hypothetical protein
MMAIFTKEPAATIFDWVIIDHPLVVAIFSFRMLYTDSLSLSEPVFFFSRKKLIHIPQLFDMEKFKPSHD